MCTSDCLKQVLGHSPEWVTDHFSMTFQISILFTNGRTIRKVMGGGGEAFGGKKQKNKKFVQRKMSVKKSMQRKTSQKRSYSRWAALTYWTRITILQSAQCRALTPEPLWTSNKRGYPLLPRAYKIMFYYISLSGRGRGDLQLKVE